MEGVNSVMMYCKKFCECHNVHQYNNDKLIKNEIKMDIRISPNFLSSMNGWRISPANDTRNGGITKGNKISM
jgi:hypothetical protein